MSTPVTEFYEMDFKSRSEAAEFAGTVTAKFNMSRAAHLMAVGPRPVVFMTDVLAKEARAYVSRGATILLNEVGLKFSPSRTAVPLRDLPDGLAMIFGEQQDRNDYDSRGGQ